MPSIERDQAIAIARRLKRNTRDTDIIALCDWVMTPSQHRQVGEQTYKQYMREYMRKWRAKRR